MFSADGERGTDNFHDVYEGTRQYFMGLPKQAQTEGVGQLVWPAPPPEEGSPAQSGAPTPLSRPPSAAAAPPVVLNAMVTTAPPRPPSEPLEPEAHIIHKPTVMREAAEKRRELPESEDDEDPVDALSPPSHIIRKPLSRAQQSPAPAPAAPCPSPARPPSDVPTPTPVVTEPISESVQQYRAPVHIGSTSITRPPDHFAPSRPTDPYSASRPPEHYRYHYDQTLLESGRISQGLPAASPQPSGHRNSPHQTYSRLTSSMPQHTSTRLRDTSSHSPPVQRYVMQSPQPPPPPNNRVPPIHHPPSLPVPRIPPVDSRQAHAYPYHNRRETLPYERLQTHHDRIAMQPRNYDHYHPSHSGYRPTTSCPQPVPDSRAESQHHKHHAMEVISPHYSVKPQDRMPIPSHSYPDAARIPARVDVTGIKKTEPRAYQYQTPSTLTLRHVPTAPLSTIQNNAVQPSSTHQAVVPKPNYEYLNANQAQPPHPRSSLKAGVSNQQSRLMVSVTSLVNQLRQSPLDLSVKTVKNSADSSTPQDDIVDSVMGDSKAVSIIQTRVPPSSRHMPQGPVGAVSSHKVDFAPDFSGQYRERNVTQNSNRTTPAGHQLVQYNGGYDSSRSVNDSYNVDIRSPAYAERIKYNSSMRRPDRITRIDLTRSAADERHGEHVVRDDRNFITEERKRATGPIVSNIPEKVVRYETWTDGSRIDRLNKSAREQQHLMSQPVYSFTTYQAHQNEQKRSAPHVYREHYYHHHHHHHQPAPSNHRYNSTEHMPRESNHYHDRNSSSNVRNVIQKISSHREHANNLDAHNGVPADERVLSILRNSLETKHKTVETVRSSKQIPDLIVIDDDPVIEITDDNDTETSPPKKMDQNQIPSTPNNHIQMPRAVDSLPRDSDFQKVESNDLKSKSPENDVASRIRTKAELKVMPPSQDNTVKNEVKESLVNEVKLLPKSQKQHLFNQIREDNLRLESVIKHEKSAPDVKTEAMNIDEIEKDAEIPIKMENIVENLELKPLDVPQDIPSFDLDWVNTCDSFMEQLKSGCHKKKVRRKRNDTIDIEIENKTQNPSHNLDNDNISENLIVLETGYMAHESSYDLLSTNNENEINTSKDINNVISNLTDIVIKQEPVDDEEIKAAHEAIVIPEEQSTIKDETRELSTDHETISVKKEKPNLSTKIETEQGNIEPTIDKESSNSTNKRDDCSKNSKRKCDKQKNKVLSKVKVKKEKVENLPSNIEKDSKKQKEVIQVKVECESSDEDVPLIKRKLLKEKEKSERLKHQLLKDLSEKSAYVKLECCVADLGITARKSIDSYSISKEDKQIKGKLTKQTSKSKCKSFSLENVKNEKQKEDSSTDSDDDISVACRLRMRKNLKCEESKSSPVKSPTKSPSKKLDVNNVPVFNTVRKPGFGDGSDFHPGWEDELLRYKRSLRMPSRLIAIPKGRSGAPFVKGSSLFFPRGSTSLPDLDPAPLSPAPSSAPSAATDDICVRRPDKLALDSDLDSNSSCSAVNKLHYDSEASTSTILSTPIIKTRGSSIVDVLIQKCGKKDESKKKAKDKEDKAPKVIVKSPTELLPTPSLGLMKNGNKGNLCAKKEKLMEDIYYLGAFRKETVAAFRNAFIKNTDGLIGATEEFAPVVLKSRTRTESRVLKQRATIKEVFGDERPASAPPTSCRGDDDLHALEMKKEPDCETKKDPELKAKLKTKKIVKSKLIRRSSSIREGLRSTKGLKGNDAKGRLMRLKKRNKNLINSLASKKVKHIKKEIIPKFEEKDPLKDQGGALNSEIITKKRFKRLFGKRNKQSSGFDYIRKKKKPIRHDDKINKVRRSTAKPSPESVQDIQKEIKGWIINKSVGETLLHRAARLGYTDCVAYCLEKMDADPSAKDNAGFTPLHVAASKGHVRISRLLLQYGADVSAAANGGIRPLHEACEYCHIEVIRLLLSYGADPLLVTYADQTPEELAEGTAALLLKLHIADVQGRAVEPWRFPPPTKIIDPDDMGCDVLSSPPPASPPPAPDSTMEIQCTEAPLPPFYSLKPAVSGQPSDGLWCLLQDVTNLLQIKSKDSLLKQIHCGSGSPKELLREIRTQEFLERAQCHQLFCAGEKVNVRASKVALVRVTDKLRQLLKIETVLIS